MENIIKTLHDKRLKVVKTITNNPKANGIQKAKKYNIPTVIIDNKNYNSREEFDKSLVYELKKDELDLVVLAGFMRILTPIFTKNIKAINIHPSLLPHFKGAKAIERSYESDMKEAGVSIHEVTSELDGGETILQKSFKKENLSFTEFEKRIHEIEYSLYPKAILKYLGEKYEWYFKSGKIWIFKQTNSR